MSTADEFTTELCVGTAESAPAFQVEAAGLANEPLELRLMGSELSANEDLAPILIDLWLR